jgi:hypothetical protein
MAAWREHLILTQAKVVGRIGIALAGRFQD